MRGGGCYSHLELELTVFLVLRIPITQGVGIAFGPDVTRRWCEANGVTGVIRSHEVRQGACFDSLVRRCREANPY